MPGRARVTVRVTHCQQTRCSAPRSSASTQRWSGLGLAAAADGPAMTAQFLSDGSASDPQAAPLAGLKVLEFRGIGPAPFAAMVLAGLGADVLRLGRPA